MQKIDVFKRVSYKTGAKFYQRKPYDIEVTAKYISTKVMLVVADFLTKGLFVPKFKEFLKRLRLVSSDCSSPLFLHVNENRIQSISLLVITANDQYKSQN